MTTHRESAIGDILADQGARLRALRSAAFKRVKRLFGDQRVAMNDDVKTRSPEQLTANPSPPPLRADELVPARGGGIIKPLWQVVPRLTGYGVVLFILWAVLSIMFPTVFTRSSERAVVNGPVNLVTSPVEGVVATQLAPAGKAFTAGEKLMTVQNPNVDRTLLVDLTSKKLDNQQRYDTNKAKLEGDQQRLAALDRDVGKYQAAAQNDHAASIGALQARLAVAKAQVDQQQDTVNRNQAMQWAGAVSEAYTDASRSQLAALSSAKQAIQADLAGALNSSKAAKGKVFVSVTDGPVATLAQRREELAAEVTQLKAQLEQMEQYGKSVDELIAAEQARIDRLSNLDIVAHDAGVVEDVLAPPGTHVAAGATLIRATNCGQSRVVAVFPRNLSDDVLPGTRVSVRVDGVPTPLAASVSEILPRAAEAEQARYFVPFPPLEKNEIYLIAKLDRPLPVKAQRQGGSGANSCAMGRWAKVSLQRPWWGSLGRWI